MRIIVSGYGQKPAETIKAYEVDTEGGFQEIWKDSLESPSFLCQGDQYLFTVTEADDYAFIYLYEKVGETYRFLDQRKIEGSALCHITYSSRNKALFGACYGTGTVFSVRVGQEGFGELLYQEVQQLSDPFEENPERESVVQPPLTRAHCVLLNKAEDQLFTVNIALDCIFVYDISEGHLKRKQTIAAPKGSGPRHTVFARNEEVLYVITEYSNEILVYHDQDGYRLTQRISTLAEDFKGISNCSTLCFSKDYRYLYAANRGADTIALFQIKHDNSLSMMAEYPCGGKHPRHMIISRDGSNLLVCNQNSDVVSCFQLDQENGRIVKLLSQTEWKSPSGILEG